MNALLVYAILFSWGGGFCAPVGAPMQYTQIERHLLTVNSDDPAMTFTINGIAFGAERLVSLERVPPGKWDYVFTCTWKDGTKTTHVIEVEGGTSSFLTLNTPKQERKPVDQPPVEIAIGDVAGPPGLPTGVDWDRIEKNREVVTLHYPGLPPREINRFMAHQLIEDGLSDDSHKWFLTFVSSDESARKAFLADVATSPLLAHARDNYHVHAYRPDDPMLANLSYPAGVLLQDPTGQERMFSVNYDGPDALVGKLRNGDPNYKPGGAQPVSPISLPNLNWELLSGVAALFIIVAFIAGGMILQRRGVK